MLVTQGLFLTFDIHF